MVYIVFRNVDRYINESLGKLFSKWEESSSINSICSSSSREILHRIVPAYHTKQKQNAEKQNVLNLLRQRVIVYVKLIYEDFIYNYHVKWSLLYLVMKMRIKIFIILIIIKSLDGFTQVLYKRTSNLTQESWSKMKLKSLGTKR